MPVFSTNEDLSLIRSDIVRIFPGNGIVTIDEFHEKAAEYVIRDIALNWYRKVALDQGFDYNEYPFDINLILDTSQFKDLACYKCLFLCYRYLAKDSVDGDAFSTGRDYFEKEYSKELSRVVESGVDYDWDSSGTIDIDEKNIKTQSGTKYVANVMW